MAAKKAWVILLGVLLVLPLFLVSANPAEAETLNYKVYTWAIKTDTVPVADVEGHLVDFNQRGSIFVFDNGEVANATSVWTSDLINFKGTAVQYVTVKFADDSIIIFKLKESDLKATSGVLESIEMKNEIVKGTGRFDGIKGTSKVDIKYFPVEQGEPGKRGYGEGAITYTLPAK